MTLTMLYLICALFSIVLVLCNIYFTDKADKLTGWKLFFAAVIAVTPFINTLFLLGVFYLAFKSASEEVIK